MIRLKLIDNEKTRVLIAEQGQNLRDFAKHINISNTYLSQILNGDRNPSPTVANKIARGLNSSISELFSISSFTKDNHKSLKKRGEKVAERSN